MLFNTIQFLIFFPTVTLTYYLIPKQIKRLWLLVASLFFYMCWNFKYVILLLTSILITYLSGLLMTKVEETVYSLKQKKSLKKCIVAGSIIINLGILFFFKYFNFTMKTITFLFSWIKILEISHIKQNILLLIIEDLLEGEDNQVNYEEKEFIL